MPTTKKPSSARNVHTTATVRKKTSARQKNPAVTAWRRFKRTRLITAITARTRDLLQRRPHRSFRRTYRRDYVRSLSMPGYIAFTHHVQKTLWANRKTFIFVIFIYVVLTVSLVSFASENAYMQLREVLNNDMGEGSFSGVWGEISKAGLVLAAGATGAFNAQTGVQGQSQVYAVLIILLTWLTTVWLLRAIMAGHSPKMRDGLYNSGAPLVSTFLVLAVAIVQLIPIALAIFAYNAAVVSGLLEGGVEAMMFWSVAGLLILLSLYWVTSTLIALVVITLPGMYPLQALRTAGDLVTGRRIRILLRMLWMVLVIIFVWAVIVIPIILFDGWIKSAWDAIWWLPLVPLTLLVMGSATVVWMASYVYLLYRKVVEDDALPA